MPTMSLRWRSTGCAAISHATLRSMPPCARCDATRRSSDSLRVMSDRLSLMARCETTCATRTRSRSVHTSSEHPWQPWQPWQSCDKARTCTRAPGSVWNVLLVLLANHNRREKVVRIISGFAHYPHRLISIFRAWFYLSCGQSGYNSRETTTNSLEIKSTAEVPHGVPRPGHARMVHGTYA